MSFIVLEVYKVNEGKWFFGVVEKVESLAILDARKGDFPVYRLSDLGQVL